MNPLRRIATIPTFEQYQRLLESTSSDQPAVHANQTIQQREDRNDSCSEILDHIKRTLEDYIYRCLYYVSGYSDLKETLFLKFPVKLDAHSKTKLKQLNRLKKMIEIFQKSLKDDPSYTLGCEVVNELEKLEKDSRFLHLFDRQSFLGGSFENRECLSDLMIRLKQHLNSLMS